MIRSLQMFILLGSGLLLIQPQPAYASNLGISSPGSQSSSLGHWQGQPFAAAKQKKPPACTPDPNTGKCPANPNPSR